MDIGSERIRYIDDDESRKIDHHPLYPYYLPRPKSCVKCGVEYIAKSGVAKYCPECRKTAYYPNTYFRDKSPQRSDFRKDTFVCKTLIPEEWRGEGEATYLLAKSILEMAIQDAVHLPESRRWNKEMAKSQQDDARDFIFGKRPDQVYWFRVMCFIIGRDYKVIREAVKKRCGLSYGCC